MPSLRELQRGFAAGLCGDASRILPSIRDTGLAASERLAIYRHAVIERYLEALTSTYPRVQATLGPRLFRGAALAYIEQQPRYCPEISRYGEDFPRFLADSADERCPAWLPDLAALEALVRRQSQAAPLDPVDRAALAALGEGELAMIDFTPQAGIAWLSSDYPVLDLWQLGVEGVLLRAVAATPAPGAVLIAHEADGTVSLRPLPLAEAAWLAALARGEDMSTALRTALARDPGFDLTTRLGAALTRGELRIQRRHGPASQVPPHQP